ncbi:protein-tyrosine phosphatase family protein [Paenibacillus barengoltzii]|uniref:protein-tyrosine phosphatase family protein n=1 Tax=Paenibacillus barengoltzii TaxID=343517 RepID=UPI003F89206F
MADEKSYQALYEDRIFVGGAADVEAMVNDEQCDVIVDLRDEATECAYSGGDVQWVKVPLKDKSLDPGQEPVIQQAIEEVVNAYRKGHKVGFHCGAGRGRAGTVAAGVLLSLGICGSVNEAVQKAKSIRSVVSLNPVQMEALNHLFPQPQLTEKERS